MDEDDRWHRLLELVGDLRRDLQGLEGKLVQQQLEHWRASSIAIRTLADWWARAADRDSQDRKERQRELDTWRDATDQKLATLERRSFWRTMLQVAILGGVIAIVVLWVFR